MANRTRDYARDNKQIKSRTVPKSQPRKWMGLSFFTVGLIGVFIFGLTHLHNLPKPNKALAHFVKKEEQPISSHPVMNKPRFEFYSILAKSVPETEASTTVASNPSPNEESSPLPQKTLEPVKKFMLQIAALKSKIEVDRLKAKLITMGYSVQVQQFDNHGSVWNRVSLGPYATQAQAEEQQQKLKQIHFTSILRRSEA